MESGIHDLNMFLVTALEFSACLLGIATLLFLVSRIAAPHPC